MLVQVGGARPLFLRVSLILSLEPFVEAQHRHDCMMDQISLSPSPEPGKGSPPPTPNCAVAAQTLVGLKAPDVPPAAEVIKLFDIAIERDRRAAGKVSSSRKKAKSAFWPTGDRKTRAWSV